MFIHGRTGSFEGNLIRFLVSPSLPNAPVHYLPAVNGAFVTRAPFVTPNANDQTIMIATPQHVNMMAPTPHFRPPAKRIDSGPHSVSEQVPESFVMLF